MTSVSFVSLFAPGFQLADTYNDGGMTSGPMTPSKRVHELSDALIEAFLQTWLVRCCNAVGGGGGTQLFMQSIDLPL